MYDADLYVAERSMDLYVAEAHREAGHRRLVSRAARLRPLAHRLSLLLVLLGGRLVRYTLPPYRPVSGGQSDGGRGATPDGTASHTGLAGVA